MNSKSPGTKTDPREAWAKAVKDGLKDKTVIRSKPLHEADRAPVTKGGPARNIELIVEGFHGCKRATGVGSTEAEAAEALIDNLVAYFIDGPLESEPVEVATDRA